MNMAHTHALLEINTGVVREAESWELTLSGQERTGFSNLPGKQEEMAKEMECFPLGDGGVQEGDKGGPGLEGILGWASRTGWSYRELSR